MKAVVLVVVVLAVTVLALAKALTRLNTAYDELTGRPMEARRTSPWLRSMRGEREESRRAKDNTTAIEAVMVLSVVAAVLAFEVWIFFFAHAVIPGVNG
jgi:Tfp pilus assembly protein PilV